LAPLGLFIGILTLAAHVRLGLGRWPVPMIESYDTKGYHYHEMLLFLLGVVALYVAGPLWAILVAIPKLRLSPKRHLLQFTVFISGFVLIFLAAKLDPTTFTEWFLD
jgi:ABC-type branched-subunit amino acid transport system permease subunit